MLHNDNLLAKSILFILGYYITATSCCNYPQKNILISIKKYSQWELYSSKSPQYVTLLNAYPFVGQADTKSAYLYVCQDSAGKDSIFILDMRPQNGSSISSDNIGEGYLLDIVSDTKQDYKDVMVTVPKNFRIPKKINFAFGKLSHALD